MSFAFDMPQGYSAADLVKLNRVHTRMRKLRRWAAPLLAAALVWDLVTIALSVLQLLIDRDLWLLSLMEFLLGIALILLAAAVTHGTSKAREIFWEEKTDVPSNIFKKQIC